MNAIKVAQQVCSRIYDEVKTTDLDELFAQICVSLITTDLQYATLASRIIISSHKNTSPSFSETIYILFNMTDNYGKRLNIISDEIYRIVWIIKINLIQ